VLSTVPRGRYNDLKASMEVPGRLIAPYAKGQQVGTLKVSLDGKPIVERPLVVLADAPEAGFWGRMSDGVVLWWKGDKVSSAAVNAVPNASSGPSNAPNTK